jgi:hypothetical protein
VQDYTWELTDNYFRELEVAVLLVSYPSFIFFVDSFGSIQVAELDWGNEDHIRAVGPPFDYIIGTDVVSS